MFAISEIGSCRVPPPPRDILFRSYFRLVYHTSRFNVATAVNGTVAHQIWWDNQIPRYQTEAFNTGSFHGYREACRVEILFTSNTAPLSSASWPLVPDSAGDSTGFRFTQQLGDGTLASTPEGQQLFDLYYNSGTPDTVLVFQFPQLITVDPQGQDLPRGFNGIAFDGEDPELYSPFSLYQASIWINTIPTQQTGGLATVFAHEISHILLPDPIGIPSFWGDNSTVFLHIQTRLSVPICFDGSQTQESWGRRPRRTPIGGISSMRMDAMSASTPNLRATSIGR